mmetsp:Transcript_3934/g.7574  ORF Transcript_3934/g.7574 Transcript_3934/m.7574 type:complete len:324 (-) Transcript_3934:3531-4502(-)
MSVGREEKDDERGWEEGDEVMKNGGGKRNEESERLAVEVVRMLAGRNPTKLSAEVAHSVLLVVAVVRPFGRSGMRVRKRGRIDGALKKEDGGSNSLWQEVYDACKDGLPSGMTPGSLEQRIRKARRRFERIPSTPNMALVRESWRPVFETFQRIIDEEGSDNEDSDAAPHTDLQDILERRRALRKITKGESMGDRKRSVMESQQGTRGDLDSTPGESSRSSAPSSHATISNIADQATPRGRKRRFPNPSMKSCPGQNGFLSGQRGTEGQGTDAILTTLQTCQQHLEQLVDLMKVHSQGLVRINESISLLTASFVSRSCYGPAE